MLANTIGIIGDIFVIVAFFLLQTRRINSSHLSYSLLNILGSFGVLYSLIYEWNLPAFVIECAWVIISGWGLYCYIESKVKRNSDEMQMIQIKNNLLKVQINLLGAEVRSVRNISTNREYMWCGDSDVWAGVSPVLFPVVGKSIDSEIRYKGQEYSVGNHGFVRHASFEIAEKLDDSVTLSLTTTEDNYPFKLQFNIIYRLEGNKLITTFNIINLGAGEASCGFGAHPAFAYPFDKSHKLNDYEIVFDSKEKLNFHPITQDALYTGKIKQVELDRVQLNENIFNNDALVYSGFSSKKVRLAEKGSNRYIQVEFDGFEYLGLWSKPKARYVCIEPWCGRADTLGFDGDIDERIGNVSIGGFESVIKSYSIEFGY
ncbi:aldose 1-epimerase family protein [Francisellaceae bacterium CB299]|jgi:galactose mutarotase-like enzyme